MLTDRKLAVILPGASEEEKNVNASALKIVKTERIGCFNPTKGRPITIKFAYKSNVDWVLSCKKNLNKGIFVDKQYSDETECKQKHLRPILAAAHRLEEYRGKCKLAGTDLIIKGKKYNWNNLDDLPQNLSTHTVSSRGDASYYGFLGELNPLSNFYPAPFIHVHYSTSEQYIQTRKADYCGDVETKQQSMQAKTALKCKSLGKEIKNCNIKKWNSVAAEKCYPGILSKFQLNAGIASFLKNTGSKTLVECCYDEVWGNGIPLSNPNCINPFEYKSQMILGSMLEQVRETLLHPNNNVNKENSNPHSEDLIASHLDEPSLTCLTPTATLHVETNIPT